MKRPSFQFYPADWRQNANLRRCSHAARGAWMDILCVLHDSDTYGLVRWPLSELAYAANVPLKLAQELAAKCVLKGSSPGKLCQPYIYTPRTGRKDGPPVMLVADQEGPIWFSSRLVKDEYLRNVRGGGSNGEDNGAAPNPSPKGTKGDEIGEAFGPRTRAYAPARPPAQSSSTSSSSSEETPPTPPLRGARRRDSRFSEEEIRRQLFEKWDREEAAENDKKRGLSNSSDADESRLLAAAKNGQGG